MSLADIAIDAADEIVGDIAAPYVLLYNTARSIGGIIPDVTIREVLADTFTITNHPVEGGTPISDHTFANPKVAELTLAWSDATAGYPGYYALAYQALLNLAATRQAFDFYTDTRSYPSMLFGEIVKQSDTNTDQAAFVTIRLQELITSQTDGGTSSANMSQPQQTGTEASVGTQTLQPAPQASVGGIIGLNVS